MEIEEIKKVIIDQREGINDFFKREKIIERELNSNNLKKFLEHPNILVISGARRSGKSTLALLLLKDEKYGYMDFDDERLAGFSQYDLNKLIQAFYELYGNNLDYFIFDEIQNVKNWEVFLTRLRKTKKIVITGSNAKLLSGELSTHLTGRYIDFTLYPFSFKEFLTFKDIDFKKDSSIYSTKEVAQIKRIMEEYIKIGGFPEVFKFGRAITSRIYGDIVTKDILFRYRIKNRNTFKELSNYLLSNFSEKISYSKLKNIFAIKNVHTIKNYVEYLSSSFLICILEKFSYKLKQKIIAPKKVYGIDAGLINAISFQFSENIGGLMENIVLLELLRKRSYFDDYFEVYYWNDYYGREVDFVLKKGRGISQLIQVCRNLSFIPTKERELKSLIKASDELNCSNLLVISYDYEGEEEIGRKKIKFIPLWKWLLQ